MGQAKLRGTKQQRIEAAINNREKMRPREMTCNKCGNITHDIKSMDVRKLEGVDRFFIGRCAVCEESILAMKGDPEVVTELMEYYAEASGEGSDQIEIQKFIRQ